MIYTQTQVVNRAYNKIRLINDLLSERLDDIGFKDERFNTLLCNAQKVNLIYKILIGPLQTFTTEELEKAYNIVDAIEPCVNSGDYSYIPVPRPTILNNGSFYNLTPTRYIYTVDTNSTIGDNQDTGTTLNYSFHYSINVYVGGFELLIGKGDKNHECYFSGDNGITARKISDIQVNDKLFYNGTITGADLVNGIDKITYKLDY